jgi:26S proteasome regulatory subunit N2
VKYQQAMGMSVECRRLDKLEEAIVRCDNIQGALSYCINLSHQYVNHREYRFEVLACYNTPSILILVDICWIKM